MILKKKVFAAILSALMAVSLAACGGGSAGSSAAAPAESTKPAESTAPAAEGAKKIGISMPTQSLERWNRDGQYLDEQFKATGYETILTFSDNKSDRQVNDIQNMIAEDVDLLIVAAIDGVALNPERRCFLLCILR